MFPLQVWQSYHSLPSLSIVRLSCFFVLHLFLSILKNIYDQRLFHAVLVAFWTIMNFILVFLKICFVPVSNFFRMVLLIYFVFCKQERAFPWTNKASRFTEIFSCVKCEKQALLFSICACHSCTEWPCKCYPFFQGICYKFCCHFSRTQWTVLNGTDGIFLCHCLLHAFFFLSFQDASLSSSVFSALQCHITIANRTKKHVSCFVFRYFPWAQDAFDIDRFCTWS